MWKLRVLPSSSSQTFLDPSVLVIILKNMEILRSWFLPDYDPFELRLIEENTVDYLGVNYYQPLRGGSRYAPNPASPYSLNNFMNPMSCQVAKINPTEVEI